MLSIQLQQKRRITVNIVLCDDNPTFLKNLHSRLQTIAAKYDWICNYKLFHDAFQLLTADLSTIDILFLDIDMPEINGITAGKNCVTNIQNLLSFM